MPYVLRHQETMEVAASIQRNIYEFDFYGVRWWASHEEAAAEQDAFLRQQYGETEGWEIVQVDEMKVKLLNVKLKNNPAYLVTLDENERVEAAVREKK